ncbi:hypothetical protein QQF64_007554 [Cirrhinus molitorella]|uniref:Gypsy retrotransposon integrase-like protein 1 n=1 Tax=Cirrhinus molitorella TaxID=172907 RepID=A0ABR3ME90_9TELE
MEGLKPPQPLQLEGNMAENWKKWKQKFGLYMTASGVETKDKKIQSCTLLHVIGDEALEIYNTFDFIETEDKDNVKEIIKKFDDYFEPQKNVTFERHIFNSRVQTLGESIDQFVTDLKTKAKSCEYGQLCDSLIKDRIVIGIRDDDLRARLLRETDLDLHKAVQMWRAAEASRAHLSQIQVASDTEVHTVRQTRPRHEAQAKDPDMTRYIIRNCKYCGRDHNKGLGCIEGQQHIKLKHDAQPVIHPPRRVPVALRNKVMEELERMEKMDVIERVVEPRAWVNSMVTIWKPEKKKVRICMDPKDLNAAIEREHYPMLTIEEVVTMPRAKVFTTLDAQSGYWQIKLDEESSKLCTFNSPFGRFAYKRLPFGISCAGEMFQRIMTQTFEEGVEVIVDDILIWVENEQQHDERLEKVMQRIRERNIKLNPEKCTFKAKEVSYMGHLLTADGLKPDPQKVAAIRNMHRPQNRTELQQYLGMITYLGKFLPQLSDVTAPLRLILEKTAEWCWEEAHQESFEKLQTMVSETATLKYYDPVMPVTLSVDASSCGVGAVILQNNCPIAFASKAFTETQKRWAQIEKELAAIVFGCEKFYQYTFGRQFTVESDHKPSEMIMKKNLADTPLRLQKMLLKLQKYDLTVIYKKGTELHIADALIRNDQPHTDTDTADNDIQVCTVVSLPIAPLRLLEMKTETRNDSVLPMVKRFVLNGWPEDKRELPDQAKPYWDYRDELTVEDDILLKGNRITIPQSKQRFMLHKLHASHQGIEKTKRLARDIMFWPGMSTQITDLISKCPVCNTFKRQNCKEPMLGHDIPHWPWQKVGSDLFEFDSEQYIVLVDYYSNFIEVDKVKNIKSPTIIQICKQHFARYGIPEVMIMDNGPAYASADFALFSKSYGFKHVTSSPKYAQSNGKAEKAVQVIKSLFKKAKADRQDPYVALLDYRNTPLENLPSPAQMFMGRRTQTQLPTSQTLLQPQCMTGIHRQLKSNQLKMKKYYDRGARPLPDLELGDYVRVEKDAQWKPAKVVEVCEAPRSYVVESDGQKLRRNRRHLIQTKEQPQKNITHDSEQECISQVTPTEEGGSDEIDAQCRVTDPCVNVQSTVTEPSTTEARYPKRVRKPPLRLDL